MKKLLCLVVCASLVPFAMAEAKTMAKPTAAKHVKPPVTKPMQETYKRDTTTSMQSNGRRQPLYGYSQASTINNNTLSK
jgi:hypothetical protein